MPPSVSTPVISAFGPLRVLVDGAEQEVHRRRERNVLATLLAARGRPVSADRLVVEVWGEEAPARALASLQVAVSRLRVMLEPQRLPRTPPRWLRSTAAGYTIGLPPTAVDIWVFADRAQAAVAARDPQERLRAAVEALEAWVDEPLVGCDTETVRREAERLVELHVIMHEIRARALLDLGEPEPVAAGLVPLLPAHPYREHLWALLAQAQYRCGRQVQALETLRTLRTHLAEDLGLDPSAEITDLERAVLNQDEALLPVAAVLAPVPAARPSARLPMVGRKDALASVGDLVDRLTRVREGGVLLVSGEPGIGKSRLVEDLADLAATRGATVVVSRCHADFAPALWPWLPVLRHLRVQFPDADDDDLLEEVLSAAEDVERGEGSVLLVFDAVQRLLARAAAQRPLVVVIEDLHWGDVTSLRLLAHVTPTVRDVPLLLVGTRRTSDAPIGDALVATLADLARAGATRIRLDGLAADEVSVLLAQALGEHDPRLDQVVGQACGGNPFFVLEYARLIQGVSDVDPARLPVPEGVRDVVRQRAARLPPEARGLLATAAVAGRVIDPDLLAQLTGTPIDRSLDLLDLALATGLLIDRPEGYAFAHALTRDTLAAELSAARRMRLHDQVSRAIEERHSGAPDTAAEIAHHAYLAAPLGAAFASRAVTALARAARVAAARRAYDEALALWRQAYETAAGPGEALHRVEALRGTAHALLRLGRFAQAHAAVADAVRLARDLGRWDLLADAVTILNRAGVWSWREHGLKDTSFVAALHEAVGHVDEAHRARLLAALQLEHASAWESDLADELGEQALRLARANGDRALLLEVLLVVIVASFGPGKAAGRLLLIEELRRLEPAGEVAVFAEFLYARTLFECARVDESDRVTARCAAAIEELRHTGVEMPFAWWLLARARDRDDVAGVEAATASLRRYHERGVIVGAALDLYYALRIQSESTGMDPALIERVAQAPAGMRALVAFTVLDQGDAAMARELLGPPAPAGAADYSVLAGDCLRVAVLAGAAAVEELPAALTRIEPYAGDVVTYGSIENLGAVDYFLAVGYTALGDVRRARRHCAAALSLLDRIDVRPWRRRAEALAARLDPTAASRAG